VALVMAVITGIGAWEWARFGNLVHPASRLAYAGFIMLLLYGCYLIRDISWINWVLVATLMLWSVVAMVIVATQRGSYRLPDSPIVPMLLG
ncbi:MAG: hypothetical protein GTO60_04260, partial [Gammaproteobacteria bacterium]|nr:hypothetical protein [Gammaproteobacteria bacterium]NIO61855.1 hypothetical protein [Gammaproteobacteria bacterium]